MSDNNNFFEDLYIRTPDLFRKLYPGKFNEIKKEIEEKEKAAAAEKLIDLKTYKTTTSSGTGKTKKKKKRKKQKGGFNFTEKFFNPIGTIIKTQIAFQNLDKIIKKDNRELNKKIKEIENDFNRMPCKSFKKKDRKECYARKRKEKTKKRKH